MRTSKLLLFTLIILLAACSSGNSMPEPTETTTVTSTTAVTITATPFPDARPDDFQIQYEWEIGSLPPPYFYKYTILIGPGASGEIVFQAGYSGDDPPPTIWNREFPVTESDLDRLYQQLFQIGLFIKEWQQTEDIPIGGVADDMTVNAYGQVFPIPYHVAGEQQYRDLNAFYDEINEMVPQSTWDELYDLQTAYALEREDED